METDKRKKMVLVTVIIILVISFFIFGISIDRRNASRCMDFSLQGNLLSLSTNDKIYVWKVQDSKLIYKEDTKKSYLSFCRISPDEKYLVVSTRSYVKLVDLRNIPHELKDVFQYSKRATPEDILFSPDSKSFCVYPYIYREDGTVSVVHKKQTFEGYVCNVKSLSEPVSKSWILLGTEEQKSGDPHRYHLKLYDAESEKIIRDYNFPSNQDNNDCLLAGGSKAFLVKQPGNIQVIDFKTATVKELKIEYPQYGHHSFYISPNGEWLAIISEASYEEIQRNATKPPNVQIYNSNTGLLVAEMELDNYAGFERYAIDSSGKYLAAGISRQNGFLIRNGVSIIDIKQKKEVTFLKIQE